jgi:two-component system response regulator AlgR
MNVLIVDDEELARSRLQRFVESEQLGEVIALASNGVQAIEAVEKFLPDVVLMDIQMPTMDGLEAARHLAQLDTPPAIIFCTAYDEFAIEAFNVQAVGYLLKPVRKEELKAAFSRLDKINKAQSVALNKDACRSHISAKTHQGLELVPVENIVLFKAEQKYISVIHKNGEVLIDEPLKDLEEEFVDKFIRVHRNSLVRKTTIQGLEKCEDGSVALRLNVLEDVVPVSRRHLSEVRKLLKTM